MTPSQRGAPRPKWEGGDHSELESLIDKCLSFFCEKLKNVHFVKKAKDEKCVIAQWRKASFDECEAC